MKTGSIIIAILLTTLFHKVVKSQDLPFVDGKVVYEVELKFDSLNKTQIFEKSLAFVNDVLVKHHFVVKAANTESAEIFTSGVTALSDKDRKGFVWDIGEASRLKFDYAIKVSNKSSKVIINNITVVKLDVNKELAKPFEDDIMDEKRSIQSIKKGKYRDGKQKRYESIANNVNNTFYSMIALYKRYVEK